jgi:NDP-sugar pyrophosphorylase family protein
MPKALVPVGGTPLIERVIRNFQAAGIASLVIIVNEQSRECEPWLRARFPELDLQVLVKTTASSLESFREVGARLGPGRAPISTVDAWCPASAFQMFLDGARRLPADVTVLAVTPLADDERPLWARLGPGGLITGLGGTCGDVVTAGIYLVSERVRRLSSPPEVRRLRDFLAWLLQRGEPMYGISLPAVVDVDRARDVALAEALARGTEGPLDPSPLRRFDALRAQGAGLRAGPAGEPREGKV